MSIRTKLLLIVLIVSAFSLTITFASLFSIKEFEDKAQSLENSLLRSNHGEHLNYLISNIVSDSRGIYLSKSSAEAKPFSVKIEDTMKEIDELLAEWQIIVPSSALASFDSLLQNYNQFKKLRLELVNLSQTSGPEAAAAIGNNTTNRENRAALQQLIDSTVAKDKIAATIIQKDINDFYDLALLTIVSMTIVSVVVGTMVALFIATKQLGNPLQSLAEVLKRIAQGDYNVAAPEKLSKDEIGDIWGIVGLVVKALKESEQLKKEQALVEERSAAEKRAIMNDLANTFENEVMGIVRSVSSASTQLQQSASRMGVVSDETSHQSTVVAAASEQAAMNVETVASAAEELSASIREISSQVSTAASVADNASNHAHTTTSTVNSLSGKAQRIGEVVSLINDIAAQTNLLALNATIEAARAGDAGRGFAVVANEVKSLAAQTAKATEEISMQVRDVQTATADVVSAMNIISSIIEQVNSISMSIASAIEEQGAATAEIARNVSQAAAGTSEVTSNITHVSQAASETKNMSSQIVNAADELSTQSSVLRQQVDQFIQRVRAA